MKMRKALALILTTCAGMAQAGDIVVAALGDSLTQGYGLPQDDGFVPQLEMWLQAKGAGVRLINAGVSGDTTAGGLSRVGWTLTPDVDAMIVALGGNDLLRGLPPRQARENIEGILQAAQAAEVHVLLIGMQAPGNFGPDYQAEFDAIYPQLAQTYDTVYLDSFFAGLGTEGTLSDPSTLRVWFQADGIHPNAEGVVQIVQEVGPKVLELIERVKAGD